MCNSSKYPRSLLLHGEVKGVLSVGSAMWGRIAITAGIAEKVSIATAAVAEHAVSNVSALRVR